MRNASKAGYNNNGCNGAAAKSSYSSGADGGCGSGGNHAKTPLNITPHHNIATASSPNVVGHMSSTVYVDMKPFRSANVLLFNEMY